MAITITQGEDIPRYPWPTEGRKPSPAYQDAGEAIHALDYAQLWGGIGTIGNTRSVRVDLQSPPQGGSRNVQIQLNDIKPTQTKGTTVAAVLLSAELGSYGGNDQQPQRQHIESQVKRALFASLDSGQIVSVSGTP